MYFDSSIGDTFRLCISQDSFWPATWEEQLLKNLFKSWQPQSSEVCRQKSGLLAQDTVRQLDGLDLQGIYPAQPNSSCQRPITFAAAVLAPLQAQLDVRSHQGLIEWPWTGRQLSAAAVHSGGGGRVQGKLCCWWRSDPTLCCPRRLCSTRDLPLHPYWIIVFANCLKAARSDPVSALLWNTHKLSGQGCSVLERDKDWSASWDNTVQMRPVKRGPCQECVVCGRNMFWDGVLRWADLARWVVPFPPNWLLDRRPQAVEKPSWAPWGRHCWSAQFALPALLLQLLIWPGLVENAICKTGCWVLRSYLKVILAMPISDKIRYFDTCACLVETPVQCALLGDICVSWWHSTGRGDPACKNCATVADFSDSVKPRLYCLFFWCESSQEEWGVVSGAFDVVTKTTCFLGLSKVCWPFTSCKLQRMG